MFAASLPRAHAAPSVCCTKEPIWSASSSLANMKVGGFDVVELGRPSFREKLCAPSCCGNATCASVNPSCKPRSTWSGARLVCSLEDFEANRKRREAGRLLYVCASAKNRAARRSLNAQCSRQNARRTSLQNGERSIGVFCAPLAHRSSRERRFAFRSSTPVVMAASSLSRASSS